MSEQADRDDVASRFWAKVDKSGGCWIWTAFRDRGGYGRFNPERRRTVRAHRFAYELIVGPIPDGLTLDHLCVNPACVRPDHLEPVTNAENSMRGTGPAATNARKTHCDHGHEFTPENTYWRTGAAEGQRSCRTCRRAWDRARKERRNAS